MQPDNNAGKLAWNLALEHWSLWLESFTTTTTLCFVPFFAVLMFQHFAHLQTDVSELQTFSQLVATNGNNNAMKLKWIQG